MSFVNPTPDSELDAENTARAAQRTREKAMTSKNVTPWPPFQPTFAETRAALVGALALLRRWRKHEFAEDKNEDYRLFSETGSFCSTNEVALGMDPQNPPRMRSAPGADYQKCLDRIAVLMALDPADRSRDGIELDHLATAIELYEKLKYPLGSAPETTPDFRGLLEEMWKFWGRPREQEFIDAGVSVALGMDLYCRVSAALGDPVCADCNRRFSQHKTVISHDFRHRPSVVETTAQQIGSRIPHDIGLRGPDEEGITAPGEEVLSQKAECIPCATGMNSFIDPVTGKKMHARNGEVTICSAQKATARHLQPGYVLEQIMNHSTDRWAQGVARTCLMGSPAEKLQGMVAVHCYQDRVYDWAVECFGVQDAIDKEMRPHRFLEEALELVQACGCTREAAHRVLEYVYSRPVGVVEQEVGGVQVTLGILCTAFHLNLEYCAEREFSRIVQNIDKIRERHRGKPNFGS